MTQKERLAKLRALQNPDQVTQDALDYLFSHVETIEVPPPEKGIDFFTEEDINQIANVVRGMVKDGEDGVNGGQGEQGEKGDQGPQGVQGMQGIPGRNGVDGETPNIDKALKEAFSKIPKTEVVDTKAIIKQALDAFKETYKEDGLKLTAIEKRLIRLGGGGASFLTQLQDVSLSSPTNGQVLKYNSTTQKWENGAGGTGTYTFIDNLTPTGTINGVNGTFTVPNNPGTSLHLYLNGQRLINLVDYTISSTTITMTTIPFPGDVLIVDYRY